MEDTKIDEDIPIGNTGSSSPASSRRSIVINTILNQLPLCQEQVLKIKEELTPTSQNLNENIKIIQSQMRTRGILEDIEPLEINFVNTESQTQKEREKSDCSNTSRAYSNNEFEDYESMEENQSNDDNKCKKSNHVISANDNANRSSPKLPPIDICSSSPSKKDNSRSSRFTSPSKTYNNDNEYYDYEEFYHKDLESARKRHQYIPKSRRSGKNDKNEKICVIHNTVEDKQSSSPHTNHSCYQNYSKEFTSQPLTPKTKGKYVVYYENCSPSSIVQMEAKGDSIYMNKHICTCSEEIIPQQTAFEFYEISSTDTTREIGKIGCCTMLHNMLRSVFTPHRKK